jgi:TolB-like protein/Tfp pilus assembly protein PilF/predicted Ser/Thr protein kinase
LVLAPGTRLGPYEILSALGAGGMGEVYLAFDTRLQREVALKVLTGSDTDALLRLTREARLASKLAHPGICTVFEAGEIDGQAFIAMERVTGEPLSALVARERLSPDRVMRLGAQMAEALARAHAHGVIHRDFKSANVIISPDGRIKILDFGIAIRSGAEGQPVTKEATASVDRDDSLAGTLAYMAPEVLRGGTADARSDIWALGIVLFEMTCGRRPFTGSTPYDLTSAILSKDPPDLNGAPAGLQSVVRRCLAKAPGERYQRASEIQAALEAIGSSREADVVAPRGRAFRRATIAAVAIATGALLVALAVAGWPWRRAAAPAAIRAIAVLPLANLSGDATQDFFADGMTEALITDLARLKGVDVISRTSVMQYKGTQKPLRQIARELSVDAVVEGSVMRAGDRVRITAQLIDGATDKHLWANDYDRDARDVLALQHDVAGAIAREVRATLVTDGTLPSTPHRVDPAAHDLYLKGSALVYRYNEPQIAEAIGLLEEAIRIDPAFAEAWAALAAAHSERGIWGIVDSRTTGIRAHEAIARALALDGSSAEAYAVLGSISMVYDWDWTAAERALKRSIELAPGEVRVHQLYASLLQALRRFPEAVAEDVIQRRLDPASSLAWSSLGRAQYRSRQFVASLDTFKHAIDLDRSYIPNYARIADVYIALRQPDEALHWLDEGQKVSGGTRRQTDGYGVACALAGRRREAEAVVRDLSARVPTSDQSAFSIAMVETALGNHDAALEWLNRAFDARSANLFLVNAELKLEALRPDPRFQDLLRRMHFPPA